LKCSHSVRKVAQSSSLTSWRIYGRGIGGSFGVEEFLGTVGAPP